VQLVMEGVEEGDAVTFPEGTSDRIDGMEVHP
jgi:hypothetical protein